MINRLNRPLAATIAAGALCLGAAACGGDDSDDGTPARPAAPAQEAPEQQTVTGGETTLRLDRTSLRLLEAAGVEIEPTGAATLEGGRLTFPIREGTVAVDELAGTIAHEGGLRFSAGGRSFEATDLVIRPGQDVLEAEVAGRRVPLLGVDLGALRAPTSDTIVLPEAEAAFSPRSIAAVEERLGVQLPDVRVPLGRLALNAES